MSLIMMIKSVVVVALVFIVSIEQASADTVFKKQDHGLWAIGGICGTDQNQLLIFESGFRSGDIVCASTDSSITDFGYYLFLECGTKTGAVTYMGEVVRTSDVALDMSLIEYRGASGAPDLYFSLERCESVSDNLVSNAGPEEIYESPLSQELDDIIPQSSLAPDWMSVGILSDDATLQDWLSASSSMRLSTAASYYAAMRSPELIQFQLASGELFIGASEIMECLNQMIQIGVQTGQLGLQQSIQPRLSGSCTVAMAFPG